KSQLSGPFGRKLAPVSLGGLTIILLIHPVTRAWSLPNESFPGMHDPRYAYGNLPIVASLWDDFMKRFHYSSERTRYFSSWIGRPLWIPGAVFLHHRSTNHGRTQA